MLCSSYSAARINSPPDVPKGFDTTPTKTTVVQIKQSLYLTFHFQMLLKTNQSLWQESWKNTIWKVSILKI